uniref:Putative sugar porter n=1 Tax=[Candida] hispaniensis TaxID=312227 RepID=A0A1N6MC50_9ASCO|nr:putative sugar porter [[Candida] hispaniensis]
MVKDEKVSLEIVEKVDSLDLRAHRGEEQEKHLTIWQSFKSYRKAVIWTLMFCLTIVMDGYDGSLTGAFNALPAFKENFGVQLDDGSWTIEAKWQTAFGMGSPIGKIVGGLAVAWISDKVGRKKALLGTFVIITGLIFVIFFANSRSMLCGGFISAGIMWGSFNTLAPTYASEVCPVHIRGILAATINLSWVIGQFISMGVLNPLSKRDDEWAYRIPIAIQWVWPAVLIPIMLFVPESPWWFIRQGKIDEAKSSLNRLVDTNDVDVDELVAYMIKTDETEKELQSSGSYWDCFKGTDFRRTEIALMAWSIQCLSGGPLIGFTTYFFQLAGLSNSDAFNLSLGVTAIGFVGTVMSWFFLAKVGRRRMYLVSLTIMIALMLVIGLLDVVPRNSGTMWATCTLVVLWVFMYDISVGPFAYIVVSETSSMRLRSKTVAISTTAYSLWSVVFQVAMPYMMNETEGYLRGKIGFIFGGLSIACLTWCWFRLPELKGRTYLEIDELFALELPAREFKGFQLAINN